MLWPDVLGLVLSKPDASMVHMKAGTWIWDIEKAHYLLKATIFFLRTYFCHGLYLSFIQRISPF